MKLDKSKDKRQKQFVDLWIKSKGRGSLAAATGFGKSRCGLIAIEKIKKKLKKKPFIMAVSPATSIKKDWIERFKKIEGINFYSSTVQKLLYDAKEKGRTAKVDFLIADEIHRYTGPEFHKLFKIVNYRAVMGLTATVPDEQKRAIIDKYCPVLDTITLRECKRNKWVAPYTIYNLGVSLSPEDREFYEKTSKSINYFFNTFEFDYGLAMNCLTDNRHSKDHARFLGWDQQKVIIHANQFNRYVSKRKEILYNAKAKIDKAEEVINYFPNRKFITFSQTREPADALGKRFPKRGVVYHSDLPSQIRDENSNIIAYKSGTHKRKALYKDLKDKEYTWEQIKEAYSAKKLTRYGKNRLRKNAIKEFKEKQAQCIFTAKALDEGKNLPSLDSGIIISGTSKGGQNIQRIGRTLRVNLEKQALIIELYIPNSQDESWLRNRQKGLKTNWINNLKEIII